MRRSKVIGSGREMVNHQEEGDQKSSNASGEKKPR